MPALRSEVVAPPDSTSDSLATTVEQLLTHRPNAVCLFVTDPWTVRAAVESILKEQVLLVTMGERYPDPRVSEHISVDLPGAAEILGANLKRVAHGTAATCSYTRTTATTS